MRNEYLVDREAVARAPTHPGVFFAEDILPALGRRTIVEIASRISAFRVAASLFDGFAFSATSAIASARFRCPSAFSARAFAMIASRPHSANTSSACSLRFGGNSCEGSPDHQPA